MVAQAAQPAPVLRLSTQDLPCRNRLSAMRDYLYETSQYEVDLLEPDASLRYEASFRVVPGASWGSVQSTLIASTRTTQLVKDGQDDLLLVVPFAPVSVETPTGGELAIAPGQAVLFSQAREMRLVLKQAGGIWALRVPHRAIARSVPRLGAAPIMAIRQDTPMLSLLKSYGQALETDPVRGAAAQQMVARQLQEMMALIVGASEDFREEAELTTVAAARLQTAKSTIDANLGNFRLNLEWLAAEQNISPRHLQRLFEREGTSFSDVLRRARAARARAMLQNQSNAHRSILSIALECGFAEPTSLNRVFRREFGLTPSEVRGNPMAGTGAPGSKRP